jgi:hypothetical protein
VPEEPVKMGHTQRWVKEASEWADGTIEGNGIWKVEGVARRFKTAQYVCMYIYIYIYVCVCVCVCVLRQSKLT